MRLKDFLTICDCMDCIFGIYVANREEPIEEVFNVRDKNELAEFFDGTVVSICPYNEDTIAVCVYVEQTEE